MYIKYNSLKPETTITFDGEELSSNSEYFVGDKRISEWIDGLPQMILDEWGTKKAYIEFDGSVYDYKLLQAVVDKANRNGYKLVCNHSSLNDEKQVNVEALLKELDSINLSVKEKIQIREAIREIQSNNVKVVVLGDDEGRAAVVNALLEFNLIPINCNKNVVVNNVSHKKFKAIVELEDGNVGEYSNLSASIMNRITSNTNVKSITVESEIPSWNSSMGDFTVSSIPMKSTLNNIELIREADVVVYCVNCFDGTGVVDGIKNIYKLSTKFIVATNDKELWLDYANDNGLVNCHCCAEYNAKLDKAILDYVREHILVKSLKDRINRAKFVTDNIRSEHKDILENLSKKKADLEKEILEKRKPVEEICDLIYKIQNELKNLDNNYVKHVFGDDVWKEKVKKIIRERIWNATNEFLISLGTLQSKKFYLASADEYVSIGGHIRSLRDYTESHEWFFVINLMILNDNVILYALLNKKSTLRSLVQKKWEWYCDSFSEMAYEFCKRNYSSWLGDPSEAIAAKAYYDRLKECNDIVTNLVDWLIEWREDEKIKNLPEYQRNVVLKNLGRVVYGKNRIDSFRNSLEQKILDELIALENTRIREKINLIQDAPLVKSINFYITKLNNSKIGELSFSTKLIGESNKMHTLNLKTTVEKYQKTGIVKTSFDLQKGENERPAILCSELYERSAYLGIDEVEEIVDEVINNFDKYLYARVDSFNVNICKYIYKAKYAIRNELDSNLKVLEQQEKFVDTQMGLLREKILAVNNEKVIINELSELDKKLGVIVNF